MFEHIDPKKDKIVYPFIKSDGYLRPCYKGCPNCKHCSDVLWDYSNGVYMCICRLHEIHDICCPDYENDGTKQNSGYRLEMGIKESEKQHEGGRVVLDGCVRIDDACRRG